MAETSRPLSICRVEQLTESERFVPGRGRDRGSLVPGKALISQPLLDWRRTARSPSVVSSSCLNRRVLYWNGDETEGV